MVELTREEFSIIAKNRGNIEPERMFTQQLLNTVNRYENRRKGRQLSKIGPKNITKIQNISEKELNQAEKLQRKSIDELQEIGRSRRIKNRKIKKEDVIISHLKSESSIAEHNSQKLFSNNNTDDTYDHYDNKIRGKLSDIRMILSRFTNMVINADRKKIKKSFKKQKKRKTFQIRKKKTFLIILLNQ